MEWKWEETAPYLNTSQQIGALLEYLGLGEWGWASGQATHMGLLSMGGSMIIGGTLTR